MIDKSFIPKTPCKRCNTYTQAKCIGRQHDCDEYYEYQTNIAAKIELLSYLVELAGLHEYTNIDIRQLHEIEVDLKQALNASTKLEIDPLAFA